MATTKLEVRQMLDLATASFEEDMEIIRTCPNSDSADKTGAEMEKEFRNPKSIFATMPDEILAQSIEHLRAKVQAFRERERAMTKELREDRISKLPALMRTLENCFIHARNVGDKDSMFEAQSMYMNLAKYADRSKLSTRPNGILTGTILDPSTRNADND